MIVIFTQGNQLKIYFSTETNMKITKQTPQQVKKDEAAIQSQGSVRQEVEDKHLRHRQRYKKEPVLPSQSSYRHQSPLNPQQHKQRVEVALNQLSINAEYATNNSERQYLMFQGSAEMNFNATLHATEEHNEEQRGSPTTVHTAVQFYQAANTRQSSYNQRKSNDNSLDSMEERASGGLTRGRMTNTKRIDDGHQDAMRVVQTKQNSNKTSRNNSPLRKDLNQPVVANSKKSRHSSNQGNKKLQNAVNIARQYSPPHYQMPLTPKVPNLDLIEDVSRASQTLAHELINTHTANLAPNQMVQLIAIVDPMYEEPESPLDTPLTAVLRQNAAIVFHRGGSSPRFLVNDAIMEVPAPIPPSTTTTKLPKVKSLRKSLITSVKAVQAVNPVTVMVPPVSDEDRFRTDRTGALSTTNKNSFERASKQYYLHQQKMLRKENLIQQSKDREAELQERLRLQNKSTSSGEYTTSTANEILLNETQEEGQIGVVVRRSNRDSEVNSPADSQPVDNRNMQFIPVSSQRGGSTLQYINQTIPLSPMHSALNQIEKLVSQNNIGSKEQNSVKRIPGMNRFPGSKKKHNQISPIGSDSSGSKSTLTKRTPKVVDNYKEFLQTQTFSQSTQQQQQQQQQPEMVMARQVVPLSSKMQKVNLLDPQAIQTQQMKYQTTRNFYDSNAQQKLHRGQQLTNIPIETEIAESSVQTGTYKCESPSTILVPRPLSFVYQIQKERELQCLNTADGTYSIESRNINQYGTMPNNQIKPHYSTDEQIEEEKQSNVPTPEQLFGSTLQDLNNNDDSGTPRTPITVMNYERVLVAKLPPKLAEEGKEFLSKEENIAISDCDGDGKDSPESLLKVPEMKSKKNISQFDVNGNVKVVREPELQQSQTKALLHQARESSDEQAASNTYLPDRNYENGSRFSNVMTLKPPSQGHSVTTHPDKIEATNGSARGLRDHLITGEPEMSKETSRFGTSDTRHVVSIESKKRHNNVLITQSSETGTQYTYGGPPGEYHPFMEPSYMSDYEVSIEGGDKGNQSGFVRYRDPETYMFLTLLKKMQSNPNANVIKVLEKIIISEAPKDFGKLKPMLYRRWKKHDHDKNYFRKTGVIEDDSFQFDAQTKKRKEFMEYCLKKVHSAIRDEPMPEKDKKKSPLNIQIAKSQRRKDQRNQLSDMLKTEYGITFKDNPQATDRLLKGLSTVELEKQKPGMYGLQSVEDIRNFEELNGFKLSQPSPVALADNVRYLNNQSQLDTKNTLGLLQKLSQTSWAAGQPQLRTSQSDGRSSDEEKGNIEMTMAANTNFDFQPNLGRRPDLQLTKMDYINKPLNVVSGDLVKDTSKVLHVTETPQGISLKESQSVKQNKPSVFKSRMRSLEPSKVDQLATFDEESRLNFGSKRGSQMHHKRNGGVKGHFSGYQRFESLFDFEDESFSRDQINKHSNPKFAEMVAKMRDPNLTADYMLKTSIRPHVIEKTQVRQLNQSTIDKHIKETRSDNQGCPLLPFHKMSPMYFQQMQSKIKATSPRPKEKTWQQLNVMLPILRQNHITNILKNDKTLILDRETEQSCKQRLLKNTIHSPGDLTAPSIYQQQKQRKRSQRFTQLEHRIQVQDIIAVKKNNDRERFDKKRQVERDEAQEQKKVQSQANQTLILEIENLAEQMAKDPHSY